MRRRSAHLWALAGLLAYGALLTPAGHAGFKADGATGMSAPPPPATSIESVQAAKPLLPHFDWDAGVPGPVGPTIALSRFRVEGGTAAAPAAARPLYGPLFRRPPPSFS
jgi:hypothetical protein